MHPRVVALARGNASKASATDAADAGEIRCTDRRCESEGVADVLSEAEAEAVPTADDACKPPPIAVEEPPTLRRLPPWCWTEWF